MKNNFPNIFQPFTLRTLTVRNRIVMMPMGSDLAGHNGKLSDEHIKYYELRAKGGTKTATFLVFSIWQKHVTDMVHVSVFS